MQLKNDQTKRQKQLFKSAKFMLGREVPTYFLQYLILSFGGSFVVQGEDESAHGVTHMCMDRPILNAEKGKEYVCPQYVIDSLNNLFLLPTKPYMPG